MMPVPVARRMLAEFLGTGLLVAVVVGSGIAAQRLSVDHGLQLLENSVVTAVALAVLITVFGPVSGGHFNPVVSLADWILGRFGSSGLGGLDVIAYLAAQLSGAVGGAMLANGMFSEPAGFSTRGRTGGHLWLGEIVATAGLLIVILGLARAGNQRQTPWAVGAYIGAAYWFTSSTSFANPAVAVGRMFSNSFAGISPGSVPGFVVAELIGGAIGLAVVSAVFPRAAVAAG